jgi:hypothetical protein
MVMTSDLWALLAALGLASVQLTVSSVLSLRQLGGAMDRRTARRAARGDGAQRPLRARAPQPAGDLPAVRRRPVPRSRGPGRGIALGVRRLAVRHRPDPLRARLRFAPPGVRPLCWLAAWIGIVLIVADLFA